MKSILLIGDSNAQYSKELKDAASEVIDSGWYLLGEKNKTFEAEYSRYIGTDYSINVSNGLKHFKQ